VPPEKQELLKMALDGLAAPFAAFLADAVADGGRRPDTTGSSWTSVTTGSP
jgi:hypothetical protein